MDVEGISLSSIIATFGCSEEFNHRCGTLSYGQSVDALDQQAPGHAPDPVGRQHCADESNPAHRTPSTITPDLLDGATGSDVFTVANRPDVAVGNRSRWYRRVIRRSRFM
jgi:hypothetical protein